jgi:hypothetical protein
MNNKRALWVAEGFLGVIAVISVFKGDSELAKMCILAIAATMNNLVDNTTKT